MGDYKILDYIKFSKESTHPEMMSTCFVVYSTKEEHVPNVIGVIEDVFKRDMSYQVVLLGQQVKSGDSQYAKLIEYLNTSSFAVVILDGFRPNVLFEFGILKGLMKPCIVLLEKNATVDISNYYAKSKGKKSNNPKIDIDKHFSDVKDRYHVIYDRNNHKELREILKEQYEKLKSDIDKSVLGLLFPGLEVMEEELEHCILSVINYSDRKNKEKIDEIDLHVFVERIDRLAIKHNFTLSDKYYNKLADIYRRLSKPSDALVYINKALAIDPNNIILISKKAVIYADLQNESLAMSAISDAIKLKPTEEFLWHNKGLLFEKFGKIDEAQICYEKAIEYDDTCVQLHYHYSSVLYEKKQYKQALKSIDIALGFEPYNDRYLLLKSLVYRKQKNKPEALKAVKDAISFNAKNADAWYQLGQLTESSTDKINYYNKSLEINPRHHAALCSKGCALSNIGKSTEALDAWAKVEKMCKKVSDCSSFLINIGTTKYFKIKEESTPKLGDIENIAEHFAKAIKNASDEEKYDCYNNIGYIQLQAGQYINAKSSLESAIAIAKNDKQPLALYNLAIAHTQLNEPEIALKILKKLELNFEDKNYIAGCLLTLISMPTQPFTIKEVFAKVNLFQETRKAIKLINNCIKHRKAEQLAVDG